MALSTVAEVPLGAVAVPVGDFVALIDEADAEFIAGHRWVISRPKGSRTIYAATCVVSRTVFMHRLVAGTPEGLETDHRNRNGLDNRRANLRHATHSQNGANVWKPQRRDGGQHSSTYKGVSWDEARGKWRAKIKVLGRAKNLGRYESEIEAALAYDRAALAAWGEFACLNFAAEVAQ